MLLPAGLDHTREFPLASQFPQTNSAHIELTIISTWTAAEWTTVIFTNLKFTRPFGLGDHRLLCHNYPPLAYLFPERHAHTSEKGAPFLIGLGRRYYCDIHPGDLGNRININLRKNQLLSDAHGVVTTPIKSFA